MILLVLLEVNAWVAVNVPTKILANSKTVIGINFIVLLTFGIIAYLKNKCPDCLNQTV